jgi:hypothetical protein
MSIVESLIKLVDPVQAQQREEERRKDREQPICLADTMAPAPRDR